MALVRVVLADDNLLVREGLVSLLERADGIELCGVAGDLTDLEALTERTMPDVVVTDIRMPPDHSDEGVRFATDLRERSPDIGVVVLSQFAEPDYALVVFAEGTRGRGYVLKDRVADADHLVTAIQTVASGGSFIDDEIIEMLIRARGRSDDGISQLSARELEVLAEIATGKTNTAIAEVLGVTGHSVEKHCSAIFTKLGVSDDGAVNRRVSAVLLFLAGGSAPAGPHVPRNR